MSLTHYLPDQVRPTSCHWYHNEMTYRFPNAFEISGILLSAGVLKLLLILLHRDLSHHLEPMLCTWQGLWPLHLYKLLLPVAG